MHGDRMKKNIKVNYKSIFKYDDHHETVQFKSDGIYEKGFDKEKFTFYNNDQKIEIILKGKEKDSRAFQAIWQHHHPIHGRHLESLILLQSYC